MKNSFKKLFTLVLSLVMVGSMSAGAFAADLNDVAYSQDDGVAEVIEINLDEILKNTDVENPNARSTISLSPSSAKLYSIGTLSANATVKITVKWTPTTYALHIGLVKSGSSSGNLVVATGGSKTFYATVSSSGTYFLMIANPSTTQTLKISKLSYSK